MNAPLPKQISGNLALDFANTVSHRGTGDEVDHIATLSGLLRWSVEAGLVESGWRPDGEAEAFLSTAHGLRRAIDAVGTAIAEGAEPPAQAIATIREGAATGLGGATLRGVPAVVVFAGNERILGRIAWSMLDLLRGDELGRLKQCQPHDCRWLFVDRTRNASRRWCEMASCGDREKRRARRRAS